MSNEEARDYLKYILADEKTMSDVAREAVEVAITTLEENQKLKVMVDTLADCLDGCPLRDPCNDLPREWCMEHCGYKQQEPSKECWIKWAEVMASV